jgi:hypothetical protein
MVRQELATAVRVCPRLAPLVRDAVLKTPSSASPEDAARITAAAAEWLPQPERNNDKTVAWGWRRHGIRVVTMLAIALEDPDVRSPNAYFGKLATQDKGAADLRLNLARILKAKGEVPPPPPVEETAAELMFAPASRITLGRRSPGICGRLSAKGPGAAGSAESVSMASSTGS